MQVPVYDMSSNKVGDMELNDSVFGVEVNVPLLHQAVLMQLASRRQGTHSTKTRGMVRGGGRKPYRQKGTGRARQGSRRAPNHVGGGVVFGPHPRDYSFSMPRKQRRLALRCALSDKAASGGLVVLDSLSFEKPRTKDAVRMLEAFQVERKALLMTAVRDENVERSYSNIPGAKTICAMGMNVHDIMKHDKMFITKDAVARLEEVLA